MKKIIPVDELKKKINEVGTVMIANTIVNRPLKVTKHQLQSRFTDFQYKEYEVNYWVTSGYIDNPKHHSMEIVRGRGRKVRS